MLNLLISVIAMLQLATSFLTSAIGTPLQEMAEQFATQAVQVAQTTLDTIQNENAISQQTAPAPVTPVPQETAQTNNQTTQKNMYTLEVISPINNKGLGREYVAAPEIVDESNYIEIGLLVKDESGAYLKTPTVEVIATDSFQNRTMAGTGNVTPIYPDGNKQVVSYYPFHYEFKTAGEHTITFKCEGIETAVTLTAK